MLRFIEEYPMIYDVLGNFERIQHINALLLLFSLKMYCYYLAKKDIRMVSLPMTHLHVQLNAGVH